jgi:RsiW-degrading membrane proteinase PrsW (M82 family)
MFEYFTPEQIPQLLVATGLSAIPAIVWFIVMFRGRKTSRWPLMLAFALGTLTVIPIMAIDYIFILVPQLDVDHAIEVTFTDVYAASFAALIFVGVTEELAKSGVVRIIDKTRIGIQTVNDSVKYSILAGLGFAFIENIFYFFFIWMADGFLGLIFPMIFRSIFTVCAHMVFSGIFGYYYGISKFSKPIMEARLWMGERSKGVHILSKILGTSEDKAYSQLILMKGLFIAMFLHTLFDFFLEFEMLIPVLAIVGGGFLFLLYLLAHKAGAIAFTGMGRTSTMAKRDQDVVLELLGLWSQKGRYKDVIDICQRLLMRDPDNKVVQLFQAKAMDAQKLSNLEENFTALFTNKDEKKADASIRALVKQNVLMEMLKEKQGLQSAQTPQPAPAQPVQNQSPPPQIPSIPTPGQSGQG